MDVVMKGRGERVTGQARARLERKLQHLSKLDGRLDRVEVEVTRESRGRIGGGHRAEAWGRSGRRTYRAHASGEDVAAALELMLDRLERQITEAHRRRRARAVAAKRRAPAESRAPIPAPE
ncbi:MAG TPA: HPF/RaiA family ribosome-associated protein [Actinomycetota bacterium]|nr:HPF/RaiA family ribosome-associated protein [Actinomycetota bacterium]